MNLSQSSATRGLEQATSDVIVIDSDSDSSSEDIWDIPNDDGINDGQLKSDRYGRSAQPLYGYGHLSDEDSEYSRKNVHRIDLQNSYANNQGDSHRCLSEPEFDTDDELIDNADTLERQSRGQEQPQTSQELPEIHHSPKNIYNDPFLNTLDISRMIASFNTSMSNQCEVLRAISHKAEDLQQAFTEYTKTLATSGRRGARNPKNSSKSRGKQLGSKNRIFKQQKSQAPREVNFRAKRAWVNCEGSPSLAFAWKRGPSGHQCWVDITEGYEGEEVDSGYLLCWGSSLLLEIRANADNHPILVQWKGDQGIFEGSDSIEENRCLRIKETDMIDFFTGKSGTNVGLVYEG